MGGVEDSDVALHNDLQEALRSLLLPTAPGRDVQVVAAADQCLAGKGVAREDRGLWLKLEIEGWRATGTAPAALRAVVRDCLRTGDKRYGEALASSYFAIHKKLSVTPLFSHDLASAFLSHARLMAMLADQEEFSAAQIARVIAARDSRVPITWKLVEYVLGPLGIVTELTQSDMEQIFERDASAEENLLADADPMGCAQILGEVAQRLGYPGALTEDLLTLAPPAGHVHGPYLQMLHYICIVAERFDHALSALYEFDPRSETGPPKWLFKRYPPALNVAGNPFLNNAKSVAEIDRAWAWPKRGQQSKPSQALVSIVDGLESLGYAARQELASWIRRWLCRLIRIAEGQTVRLPASLSAIEQDRLLRAIAAENTGSRGIAEQRLVDALASLAHPAPDWIPRGVGDSVNTNNVSQRKCGDCDFQDTAGRRVVAYEAHGGTLTEVYVREHLRTLEPILRARRAAWDANVAPGQRWAVEVIFVAHAIDFSGDIAAFGFELDSTDVNFDAVTYRDFIEDAKALSQDAMAASIDRRLLAVMAQERTPDTARARLLDLISS